MGVVVFFKTNDFILLCIMWYAYILMAYVIILIMNLY